MPDGCSQEVELFGPLGNLPEPDGNTLSPEITGSFDLASNMRPRTVQGQANKIDMAAADVQLTPTRRRGISYCDKCSHLLSVGSNPARKLTLRYTPTFLSIPPTLQFELYHGYSGTSVPERA
jgi:hypothetical protein